MRKSIAASIRISEIRDRLVELDGIETRSTEQESELTALMAERTTKEAEFRTESKAEEDAQLHPRDFDVLPETRERLEYRSKTGLADFMAAAAGGREVVGAAADYAAACGVSAPEQAAAVDLPRRATGDAGHHAWSGREGRTATDRAVFV